MRLTSEDAAWLRLSLIPDVRTEDVFRMAEFGGPEAVFDASYGTLIKMVGEVTARRIRSETVTEAYERACTWLEATDKAFFVKLTDADYPPLMIAAGVAPLVIYGRGNRSLLAVDRLHFTVAGSGRPDKEGEYNAREFGAAFGRAGLAFSVGLYPGVETLFLDAAVNEGRAQAIVWSSTGPDRIWPRENAELLHSTLEAEGLLLSSYAPGTGISEEAKAFQPTCRLAAASGLLVIRASRHSECLQMARLAGDWGRDLFVVPGSIHDPQSKGCHLLLKQGARLTESIEDVKEGFLGRH